MKIKRATAIYSGGGIYLYYAELENGNWVFGEEQSLVVVNKNPLESEETFEDSCFAEWQEKHLVEYIHEDCCQQVLNDILDVIFKGRTIKEWDNFVVSELKAACRNVPNEHVNQTRI